MASCIMSETQEELCNDKVTSSSPDKVTSSSPKKTKKIPRWTWKRPEGKPCRPLSAYNLFFRDKRVTVLREQKTSGGFGKLARLVSDEWKKLPSNVKGRYKQQALEEKAKYGLAIQEWKNKQDELVGNKKMGEDEISAENAQVTCPPKRSASPFRETPLNFVRQDHVQVVSPCLEDIEMQTDVGICIPNGDLFIPDLNFVPESHLLQGEVSAFKQIDLANDRLRLNIIACDSDSDPLPDLDAYFIDFDCRDEEDSFFIQIETKSVQDNHSSPFCQIDRAHDRLFRELDFFQFVPANDADFIAHDTDPFDDLDADFSDIKTVSNDISCLGYDPIVEQPPSPAISQKSVDRLLSRFDEQTVALLTRILCED